MFTNHIYSMYMYKQDLILNNLQQLICHKTKSKQFITKKIVATARIKLKLLKYMLYIFMVKLFLKCYV